MLVFIRVDDRAAINNSLYFAAASSATVAATNTTNIYDATNTASTNTFNNGRTDVINNTTSTRGT